MTLSGKSRVLVVDDSAVMRRLLVRSLSAESDIDVVAEAADAFAANELIGRHRPDVVTLDLEMPRVDGLTFLRHLMKHNPLPVIVISSHTKAGSAASIEALRVGAIDAIPKPKNGDLTPSFLLGLKRRVRQLRAYPPRLRVHDDDRQDPSHGRIDRYARGLIAIGASTGGPLALEKLLSQLPRSSPPILVVQHMPAEFTKSFAKRLNEACALRVVEAASAQEVAAGVVYVAPGDQHMIVQQGGGYLRTALRRGARLHHQRPSVDVLFESLLALKGVPVLGVLLTGMGEDGAAGLLSLSQAGHDTIAQDEASCVVFGMPREAIARGAAKHVLSLERMPDAIAAWCSATEREPRRSVEPISQAR